MEIVFGLDLGISRPGGWVKRWIWKKPVQHEHSKHFRLPPHHHSGFRTNPLEATEFYRIFAMERHGRASPRYRQTFAAR